MLTYELKKQPGVPLYEALYRCIREDILIGRIAPGQKLPSKRALAQHLEVSNITVEGAYDQLLAEGYIRSQERVGYFAEAVDHRYQIRTVTAAPETVPAWQVDLTANGSTDFPFSVWSRLQRKVMQDYPRELLRPMPNQGLWELRRAIAEHLAGFRGMQIAPENILVGAGTDFLYNLLIQLLGREKIYAVEEPGYGKIRKIYAAGGVKCISAPMDSQGVIPGLLQDAQVLHISPSHHFPTGIVAPRERRMELLRWAYSQSDRYIIEDDYDSEFRFSAHPMPAMQSMDSQGRVIYMNTFSKTLAPSIRISYMVLPPELMARFQAKLGFYSCTVPSFEQYTLTHFLREGHFEKHLNRMRKAYKSIRNAVAAALLESPYAGRITLLEQDAGLHFLLKLGGSLSEAEVVYEWEKAGVRVRTLGSYYHDDVPQDSKNCLVINYSGLGKGQIQILSQILQSL